MKQTPEKILIEYTEKLTIALLLTTAPIRAEIAIELLLRVRIHSIQIQIIIFRMYNSTEQKLAEEQDKAKRFVKTANGVRYTALPNPTLVQNRVFKNYNRLLFTNYGRIAGRKGCENGQISKKEISGR